MKKNIFILLSLCIVTFSCSDSNDPIKEVEKPPVETEDPFITLKKSNVDFTNEGGSEAISIESNVTWTTKSSASWCTVSPSSGNKSTESIKIASDESETYDDRSCTVTIEGEGITKTITVNQSQEDALILSEKDFDLSSEAQSVEVELKTNIDYEVIIPDLAKTWVSYTPTRGLRTETLLLNIAPNKSDEARSTIIYINSEASALSDTLTIIQNGKPSNVYWLDYMGILGATLNKTQKDTITTMIVKGEMNKEDFRVMKYDMPKLRYIDLKDVKCESNKIPNNAFGSVWNIGDNNTFISTIILPKSINTIGKEAFADCSGLTGPLLLPDGLKRIEDHAFNSCVGLTGALILPDGLESIGVNAFWGCTGFTGSLNLPNGLKTIEHGAFNRCTGFTGSLTFPEGLTTIEQWAFYNCSNFTGSLTLPNGLTSIGRKAFANCSGFNGTLTLPDGLTTIEPKAFSNCSNLKGLVFGNDMAIIRNNTFEFCSNISGKVVFPLSIKYIESDAFLNCYRIVVFRFPHTTPPPYLNGMLPKSVPVKVPNEAVSVYESANGWKEHTIVGY